MALTRWNPATFTPVHDLVSMQDEVNRLFDSFFNRGSLRSDLAAGFLPNADIEETPEEFVVRMDLPGVNQKDVKVSLMGDTLTIRGERRQAEAAKGNYHRVERVYGVFERSFSLGAPVRNDKVHAQYRDGVLEVRIPKAEEARLREIEVQVG